MIMFANNFHYPSACDKFGFTAKIWVVILTATPNGFVDFPFNAQIIIVVHDEFGLFGTHLEEDSLCKEKLCFLFDINSFETTDCTNSQILLNNVLGCSYNHLVNFLNLETLELSSCLIRSSSWLVPSPPRVWQNITM